MKHLSFWFDPISPFAYLAFERLPQVLEHEAHEDMVEARLREWQLEDVSRLEGHIAQTRAPDGGPRGGD